MADGRVRVKAITARGIGSYLHGARLDLRPLTVLCGENGSGKSTWIRLLSLLRNSASAGVLPFGLRNDLEVHDPDEGLIERRSFNFDYTNSIVHEDSEPEKRAEVEAEGDHGPVGTIGLELEVESDLTLPGIAATTKEMGGALWTGFYPAGTPVRIRVTHPTQEMRNDVYRRGFELSVAGKTSDSCDSRVSCMASSRPMKPYTR